MKGYSLNVFEKVIFTRIDVDTVAGLRRGVPLLLELLEKFDARATFFVPMGPDRLVHAGFRRFFKKDFLSQAAQMNPMKVYGPLYLLKGLLGLNGKLGSSHPHILHDIRDRGHEIALHGWDHAWWSDNVMSRNAGEICVQINKAVDSYKKIFGEFPRGWGAPGWRCRDQSLIALDKFGFRYISECEGPEPGWLFHNGYRSTTLNLPLTLPTLFEILYLERFNFDTAAQKIIEGLHPEGYNMFGFHAEYEVFSVMPLLEKVIATATENGYRFLPVNSFFDFSLDISKLPVYEILHKYRRGAVGPTAYHEKIPLSLEGESV